MAGDRLYQVDYVLLARRLAGTAGMAGTKPGTPQAVTRARQISEAFMKAPREHSLRDFAERYRVAG